jgi:hypothetical protein
MADTPLHDIKLRVSVSGWKKRAEILKSSAELGSFTLPIDPRSPAGSVCIYQRARLAPGQHGNPLVVTIGLGRLEVFLCSTLCPVS